MRQIALATSLAAAGVVSANTTMKSVGFAYRDHANNDALKFSLTPADFAEPHFNLVLKRAVEDGGDLVFPIHKNAFRFSKASFTSGSLASGILDLSELSVNPHQDYTVLFAKKGLLFNHRNRWTCTVRSGEEDTPAIIAKKIADYVNDNVRNLGLKAELGSGESAAKITLTATVKGQSYVCIPTDALSSIEKVHINFAWFANGNKVPDVTRYIADLVSKAAADSGFEYTYRDANIYPGLFGSDKVAYNDYKDGVVVYTLCFAEPRMVKTTDDVVKQIVQIVLPSSVTTTNFDILLAAFGNEVK